MEKLFWCWIFPSSVAGSLAVGTTRLLQPLLKKLYVDDQRLISILSMMFFCTAHGLVFLAGKKAVVCGSSATCGSEAKRGSDFYGNNTSI